jgi:hypothetical protein
MHPVSKLAACLLLIAASAAAQDSPGRKAPSVTLTRVPLTSITRGKPGTVELQFKISPGFHINSNTPKSEFLIPTALKLNAPTDIVVGKVTYPDGVDRSFPFAPDEKINVYSGTFELAVVVRPLGTVVPGKYALHGQLKYQACDNAACYPPKKLPVDFEVKVEKAKSVVHKKNPGQSPHAHN